MDTLSHNNLNGNANKSVQAPSQLALPTGPITLLRGGRRERTDEDRAWHSKQLAVQHEKRIDKLVFERMAFYGSLNPERTAYPSVKRLSDEALCSERSARYALRRLESEGLIKCLDDVGGRPTSRGGRTTTRYRVVGSNDCRAGGQTVPPWGANRAPEVLREGRKNKEKKEKALSVSVGAQTQDHGETGKDKSKADDLPLFPSPSQEQNKARAPVTETQAVYRALSHPKQVALYCALRRKLGLDVNLTKEVEFDKLPHSDKARIINDLEARERELVHQGRVSPAPIKKSESTGYLPPKAVAAADEALHRATCRHEPAEDLPINCRLCGGFIGAGFEPGLVAGGGDGGYARA